MSVKVSLGYASCSFFSSGMGNIKCPLCGTVVPENTKHECALQHNPPPAKIKQKRKLAPPVTPEEKE